MKIPHLALVLAGGLLAVPAAVLGVEEPAPPPAPAGEAPAAPIATAESDDAMLERISGEMMKKVEEIRGLKFKQDVKRVWKSRDEAKSEMLAELEKQDEKLDLASISKLYALLGIIKDGEDIKAKFAELIAAAAGGYYIPETKVFSLVRGMNLDANRPVVFHELVHAVEDQYFDWNDRTERYADEDRSDPGEALHAVVEGSARRFENLFVDSEPGLRAKYMAAQMQESIKQYAAVRKAPPALAIAVGMFPYENGSLFLSKVLPAMVAAEGSKYASETAALAAIYADPPMSTEQILHPEKYLGARDLPRQVALPDAAGSLGEGWRQLIQDSYGEFTLGLVLNASLLPNVFETQVASVATPAGHVLFRGDTGKAVTGWDADRFALYESKDGQHCLAWVTAWDSPADAAEFAEVYGKVVVRKYGTMVKGEDGKSTRQPPASAAFEHAGWSGTRWTGTRNGDSVVVVKGDLAILVERVPAASLPAFLEAVAKASVIRDPKDAVPAADGGAVAPDMPKLPEGGK
ncbi:MAG TPA: hypothetical protein VFS92_07065 [Planctomycetota bacterium]|nr:hypothetical protein [Planctomycetota bacterium]